MEEDSRCENNLYRGRRLEPRGPLQSLGVIERAGGPGAFPNAPQCLDSRL
jgi:hypothetical protein